MDDLDVTMDVTIDVWWILMMCRLLGSCNFWTFLDRTSNILQAFVLGALWKWYDNIWHDTVIDCNRKCRKQRWNVETVIFQPLAPLHAPSVTPPAPPSAPRWAPPLGRLRRPRPRAAASAGLGTSRSSCCRWMQSMGSSSDSAVFFWGVFFS